MSKSWRELIWDGNLECGNTAEIVPRGFIHVVADARGAGNSKGVIYGGMTQKDGEHGFDLVEWITQQPWCDGNVGMPGYSY